MNVDPFVENVLHSVSEIITTTEEKFKERGFLAEATYGDLKWQRLDKKFRIVYPVLNRPLRECPIEVRMQCIEQIPGLVEAVKTAAFAWGKSLQRIVNNVEDVVLDL